jgi:hypothetical protein
MRSGVAVLFARLELLYLTSFLGLRRVLTCLEQAFLSRCVPAG